MITRFAPSPTGLLHLGHVYAAAYANSLAKKNGGECLLRFEQIQTELANITNAPHGPEGSHYPQTCKRISADEANDRIENGELPSWRFDSEAVSLKLPKLFFTDSQHGKIKVDAKLLGDTILARKDIGTSYHLAVVHDDYQQNITDVTRADDLLYSTHIHRILQELLGFATPLYHHHQLIIDDQGKRLAKRHDSLSIKQLREEGQTAEEIFAKITHLLPSD